VQELVEGKAGEQERLDLNLMCAYRLKTSR
jgi:hypothetical protein